MKVSVAMATYNGEEYIAKQLNSIVTQSIIPEEIVICDDCSKDQTVEIVNDFVKRYPTITWKLIQNEKNLGYIKNFFNAISHTTGDIIILSDQDDIWDKEKVELFVDFFSKHEDMLSIHTEYSLIDLNDNVIAETQIGYKDRLRKYSVKKFRKRLNYCGMSSAFRSSLKGDLLSLNPEIIPTHDWTIHALAIVNNGMYISNEITSFRRHTGKNVALNIEKKISRKGTEQRIRVTYDYLNYYKLLNDFCDNESEKPYLNRLINVQETRINYLENKNLMRWITRIKDIAYYPSIKAFVCDGLYLIGVF